VQDRAVSRASIRNKPDDRMCRDCVAAHPGYCPSIITVSRLLSDSKLATVHVIPK